MRTRVQKWGNSLAVRIPRAFADELGVQQDSEVDMSLRDDRLVLQPVQQPHYRLADLLAQVREDNVHEEFGTGDPVGREEW